MGLLRTTISGTSDGSGALTAKSLLPLNGVVIEIRNNSSAWGTAADYTFTRDAAEGGGTVAVLTNKGGPFSVYPRADAVSTTDGGGSAIVAVPVDGHLALSLAGAATAQAGTIHIYYES